MRAYRHCCPATAPVRTGLPPSCAAVPACPGCPPARPASGEWSSKGQRSLHRTKYGIHDGVLLLCCNSCWSGACMIASVESAHLSHDNAIAQGWVCDSTEVIPGMRPTVLVFQACGRWCWYYSTISASEAGIGSCRFISPLPLPVQPPGVTYDFWGCTQHNSLQVQVLA